LVGKIKKKFYLEIYEARLELLKRINIGVPFPDVASFQDFKPSLRYTIFIFFNRIESKIGD